jgi:alpha-tubulin suppressor-like RCC1 family protein
MRVVLTTDACNRIHVSDAVTIRVTTRTHVDDDGPVSAATSACKDGRIGDIVLVPSGQGPEIAVRVVADIDDPSPCTKADGYKGCIVARRIIKFVPHTPLTLPIALDASCVGVPCDENTTCVNGACVNAEVMNPALCVGDGGCALSGEGGIDSGTNASSVDWVSAGYESTCARKTSGDVYCWGYNSTGTIGMKLGMNPVPVLATSLKGAKQIVLSANHGCAIGASGTVLCWGNPINGVLGDGQTTMIHEPSPVMGNLSALQISVGLDFTCASLANAVACWGDNSTDQIGIGAGAMSYASPQMTSTAVTTAISAGYNHACFIAKQAVSCWGSNPTAQPKVGASTDPTPTPTATTVSGVELVAAGGTHTCAAGKGSSSILCWGANAIEQLGAIGPSSATPKTVIVNGGVGMLGAGNMFTCALVGSGEMWCWGSNESGQLGIGAPDAMGHGPTKVPLPSLVDGITVGNSHACAWTKAGSVWCWGLSTYGQVGNGPTMVVYSPAAITLP